MSIILGDKQYRLIQQALDDTTDFLFAERFDQLVPDEELTEKLKSYLRLAIFLAVRFDDKETALRNSEALESLEGEKDEEQARAEAVQDLREADQPT